MSEQQYVDTWGYRDDIPEVLDRPAITQVMLLGVTPQGLVRVQLQKDAEDWETTDLKADDVSSTSALERATGCFVTRTADEQLRNLVIPDVPIRLFRTFRADALAAMEFPEVQWVIPDTLPEGLAVFAGKPKVGKSWWAMGQAVEVARNGGDVLYLALEDPPRRLQARMRMVLQGRSVPHMLEFHTDWRRLDDGGLEDLASWLEAKPNARLIVVDTIAKVRPTRGSTEDQYLGDYSVWGPLQALTITHPGVAILGVHHQRKGAAEDILDTVLGSQGVTGVADTILVLKKSRGQADAELFVTGRDIDERERALTFADGIWSDVGDAADSRRSRERDELLTLLTVEGPQATNEAARKLGIRYPTAYMRLRRAEDAGQVRRTEDQKYVVS